MSKYRTAQGKIVDMGAIIQKNEKTRAVGNMKVNARGDTIDSEGKVILPVTEKVSDKYSKSVGHRSAQSRKAKTPTVDPAHDYDLTQEEKDLLDEDISDKEIEAIKSKETKK